MTLHGLEDPDKVHTQVGDGDHQDTHGREHGEEEDQQQGHRLQHRYRNFETEENKEIPDETLIDP